jgi:hypothetical protein
MLIFYQLSKSEFDIHHNIGYKKDKSEFFQVMKMCDVLPDLHIYQFFLA